MPCCATRMVCYAAWQSVCRLPVRLPASLPVGLPDSLPVSLPVRPHVSPQQQARICEPAEAFRQSVTSPLPHVGHGVRRTQIGSVDYILLHFNAFEVHSI